MKPLLTLLVVGVAVATTHSADAVRVGEPAPSFVLATPRGESVDLARLRGSVVYVDFWASWCAPCRRSFPWLNAMHERYRAQGLAIVGVGVDKRQTDAERFLRDVPATFTIVLDPQGGTPAAFDVKGMPSSYLIDRQGVVAAIEEGFRAGRETDLEARIRALLEQPAR
jgi:cytochrome c biogenesis protein CcmG, thiol:disulfide interchange protein DsbE